MAGTGRCCTTRSSAASARPYAYLPIVAGGTSFMYHLDVNGQRITDLRLSGATISKIFTGAITNWNDPAITADDGRTFPNIPIIPVVRSDGSGTTAQFTAYMANVYPDIWNPFCAARCISRRPARRPRYTRSRTTASRRRSPRRRRVRQGVAEQRCDHLRRVRLRARAEVPRRVRAEPGELLRAADRRERRDRAHEGAHQLGPDAGPRRRVPQPGSPRVPVVELQLHDRADVALGELQRGKGETLGRFILYFLCTGQQKAKRLGYSPLPPNLVGFGFEAVTKIPARPRHRLEGLCEPDDPRRVFAEAPPLPPKDAAKGSARKNTSLAGGKSTGGSGSVTAGDLATTTETTIAADSTGAEVDGASTDADTELATATRGSCPTSVSKAADDVPIGFYIAIIVMVLAVVFAPPALAAYLRRRRTP